MRPCRVASADEQEWLRFFTYRRVWLFAALFAAWMMIVNLDKGLAEAVLLGGSFGLAIGAPGSLFAWFLRAQHEGAKALRKGPPRP